MEGRKGPIIIIVILLIIIVGLAGYIAVDKLILSKKEDNTTSVVNIDDANIDLNALYQISDTLAKFDNAFNVEDSDYFGYPYRIEKRLMAKDFNNGAALYVSIHDDLIGTSTAQYLIGGNVKKNFEKIFGKNLAYKPVDIEAGESYIIKYNESNGNFTYTAPSQSSVYSNEYITKNIKTKIEEESVLVTRRIFYVEYQGEKGSTDITQAKIYQDENKNKLIGTVSLRNNSLSEDEVLAKYGSKLNEYIFTFKQNNSTDDYCLFSIEKTR